MMGTLSDYNNNPGNLRPPKGVTYEGQIGVDDKGFAVFENKQFGQRALINDVMIKIGRGIDTPDKFVDKFTPAGPENDEDARENYKIYLANQLGLKSTSDPFPKDAAERLAQAVSRFEGGTWADTKVDEKEAFGTTSEPPKEEPATTEAESDSGERAVPKHSSDLPGAAERFKPAGAVVGAVTGLGTAGGIETGKKLIPLVPNILNRLGGQEINPNKPMTRGGLQNYLNSQIDPKLRLSLADLEKEANLGKIRTMSEVQAALKQIQGTEAQRVAKQVSIDPKTGMPRNVYSTTPGRAAIDLSKYESKAGPLGQAVGRQLQTAGEVVGSVLPSVGRIGLGALGGANAVMSGYDAWETAKKLREMNDPSWVDYARLATKGLAAVGGGMSVVPFGLTQGVGAAFQAPEAVWSGVDALNEARRNATKEQTDRALTNVDPMGNPVGNLP